jgi:2-hydroxy-3-oxopropionate reductase
MAAAGVELYAALLRQGLGDRDLAVVRQAIANLSGNGSASASASGTASTTANNSQHSSKDQ